MHESFPTGGNGGNGGSGENEDWLTASLASVRGAFASSWDSCRSFLELRFSSCRLLRTSASPPSRTRAWSRRPMPSPANCPPSRPLPPATPRKPFVCSMVFGWTPRRRAARRESRRDDLRRERPRLRLRDGAPILTPTRRITIGTRRILQTKPSARCACWRTPTGTACRQVHCVCRGPLVAHRRRVLGKGACRRRHAGHLVFSRTLTATARPTSAAKSSRFPKAQRAVRDE